MLNLLKTLYARAEGIRGPSLILFLLVIFVIFSSIGFIAGVGLLNSKYSTISRIYDFSGSAKNATNSVNVNNSVNGEKSYEGRIVYVDPAFYPLDNISFVLKDSSGKEIILLKAADHKLEVSEGHFAVVYGNLAKTVDGKKDVLLVDRIVITQQ